MYKRSYLDEDPYVNIFDHPVEVMYAEASTGYHHQLVRTHGGMDVFIRKSSGGRCQYQTPYLTISVIALTLLSSKFKREHFHRLVLVIFKLSSRHWFRRIKQGRWTGIFGKCYKYKCNFLHCRWSSNISNSSLGNYCYFGQKKEGKRKRRRVWWKK